MSTKLGHVLVEAGLVTPEDIEQAVSIQGDSGRRLGEILVDMGLVTESDVVRAVSAQLGIPCLVGSDLRVDHGVATLIDRDVATKYIALPFRDDGDALLVAMADPLDIAAADDIARITGRQVRVAMAGRRALLHLIRDAFERPEPGPQEEEKEQEDPGLRQQVQDAPAVKMVDRLIQRAIDERTSDIHIQPEQDKVRVRYRVDGLLQDFGTVPTTMLGAVVSRIKIMADMDISIRRRPQDGRIQISDEGQDVDLRVSTFPTIYGEKTVMRVLDRRRAISDVKDLGFAPAALETYTQLVARPHGILVVTGPTGSGKTTTLAATLRQLNSPEKNIVTIEDPVEYEIPGVNQATINERAGLTFANALRSIVRQDPDIIMVGEMRDMETVSLSVRAALTGHLVLSTFHTNDAVSTISRLLDMGVEPYLTASALVGVISQRLVRTLCTQCRVRTVLEPGSPEHLSLRLPDRKLELYRAVGCAACNRTGYRGRTAVFEVMTVGREMRELISDRASTDALGAQARRDGMMTLFEDAVEKAIKGLTSLDEVRRVTYTEE